MDLDELMNRAIAATRKQSRSRGYPPDEELDVAEADHWIKVGERHAQAGDFDAAINAWDTAVDLNPLDPLPCLYLAHAYVKTGQTLLIDIACESAAVYELPPEALEYVLVVLVSEARANDIERDVATRLLAVKPGHLLAQKVLSGTGNLIIENERYAEYALKLRKAKTHPVVTELALDLANPEFRKVGIDHPMARFITSAGVKCSAENVSVIACSYKEERYLLGVLTHSPEANPPLRFYPGAKACNLSLNWKGKKYVVPDSEYVGWKPPRTTTFASRAADVNSIQGSTQTKHEKLTFPSTGVFDSRPWFGMTVTSISALARLENLRVEHRVLGFAPKGPGIPVLRWNFTGTLIILDFDEFAREILTPFSTKGRAFRVEFLVAPLPDNPRPGVSFAVDKQLEFHQFGHSYWFPDIALGACFYCLPAST